MFSSRFSKPLRLELDDRTVTFQSIGDFEFSLASRTEVPAGKVTELVRFAAEQLKHEATNIREVERRFVSVLSKSLEESGSIGYLMREMDPKLFSSDHEWRDIMRALTRQGQQYDEYKKVALVKYMQYLGSRQDVLKSIYANKDRIGGDEPESADQAQMKATLIFDVSEPPAAKEETPNYERLARGETVVVRIPDGAELEVILSRHPFKLIGGARFHLVDDHGIENALSQGRNSVGREPESDVVVDSSYRDVSRQHLIIEVLAAGSFALTDLSSHGTFVPRGIVGAGALEP